MAIFAHMKGQVLWDQCIVIGKYTWICLINVMFSLYHKIHHHFSPPFGK